MKKIKSETLLKLLIIPLSIALGFLFKITVFHLLSALFKAWNISQATYAYAPGWAQSLLSLSDVVIELGFLFGLCLPVSLFAGKYLAPGRMRRLLYYPALGVLLSVLTVGVFLLVKSARMPESRVYFTPVVFAIFLFYDLFSSASGALLLRAAPERMLSGRLSLLKSGVSVYGQAALCLLLVSPLSPAFVLNALLSGVVLFLLFQKTGSVFPEIALTFSCRFFTRFVFGYPDLGGAYPVSESWLTGAQEGIMHSALLTFYLALIVIIHLVITDRSQKARAVAKGDRHV